MLKTFCTSCLKLESTKDENAVNLIIKEYTKDDVPWYLAFSGGKDSTAVLTLVFNALLRLKSYHKIITVVYCDTGVEIPSVSSYVHATLNNLKMEAEQHNLPLAIQIARPKLNDRYFVKVIGRGYPPPTNIFRWCTDRLRINPIKMIINPSIKSIVLLGVRKGESQQRDKTLQRHRTRQKYYLNQGDSSMTRILSPILEYSLRDVWSTIKFSQFPESIDYTAIGNLYKDAGAECPVFRETKGTPCGKGRFGCWTCTVVRKDKSVMNLVENGYSDLKHLFEFRNWLVEFRDNEKYRCKTRRNGARGLGPITLKGRRTILRRLLKTQEMSGMSLISEEEIARIKELWKIDRINRSYKE